MEKFQGYESCCWRQAELPSHAIYWRQQMLLFMTEWTEHHSESNPVCRPQTQESQDGHCWKSKGNISAFFFSWANKGGGATSVTFESSRVTKCSRLFLEKGEAVVWTYMGETWGMPIAAAGFGWKPHAESSSRRQQREKENYGFYGHYSWFNFKPAIHLLNRANGFHKETSIGSAACTQLISGV